MPNILFVHENYPAQFGALAGYLRKQGWRVMFATARDSFAPKSVHRQSNGVQVVRYARKREPSKSTHRYLAATERAVLNGQGFAETAVGLKRGGFEPDLVVMHSGWGSGSFARAVWPDTKIVQYLEWWYQYPPVDVPRASDAAHDVNEAARQITRNLPFLLDFQQADLVVSPTQFQADRAPDSIRKRITVLHDGVDCSAYHPAGPGDPVFTWDGLPDDARIVTFATRGMEPTRGFPTFMEAAARLQAANPDVHVVIAGRDTARYGPMPKSGGTWKSLALETHAFDTARLHFTGLLALDQYRALVRRSAVQCYLSRPFVLSWSLIEAMASACPLVVSDVEPIREALPDNSVAVFTAQEDADAVLQGMQWCLDNPDDARAMAANARAQAIQAYDIAHLHPAWTDLFSSLLPQAQ